MDTEHTGKALGADLHRLLLVARDRIPALADYYLDANRLVASTADTDSWAFAESRMGPVWMALRDEYQGILGRTFDNLRDTGIALERIVGHYAATDEAAAAELRKLVADSTVDDPAVGQPQAPSLPEPQLPGAQ